MQRPQLNRGRTNGASRCIHRQIHRIHGVKAVWGLQGAVLHQAVEILHSSRQEEERSWMIQHNCGFNHFIVRCLSGILLVVLPLLLSSSSCRPTFCPWPVFKIWGKWRGRQNMSFFWTRCRAILQGNTLCFRTFQALYTWFEHVGHLVGHLIYLHVGHHVQLDVGQFFSSFLSATMLQRWIFLPKLIFLHNP